MPVVAQSDARRERFALPPEMGLAWVEFIKAIALIWVFLNHVAERIFGGAYWSNPAVGWPELGRRIAQLSPIRGHGLLDIPLNLLRYIGWCGDQGVQLFLIVSGFGIAWGLLVRGRDSAPTLGQFYLRRAERIYPLWWACHLLFLLVSFAFGAGGVSLRDTHFYLSALGFRLSPEALYYFTPAWWYVGLVVQLYIVFPLLWAALRVLGAGRFLLLTCAVSFTIRAAGLVYFDYYLDAWARGAIFVTRLPEFALGMSLAVWMRRDPHTVDAAMRRPATVLAALLVYAMAAAMAITLLGMTLAPFLLGASAFVALYAVSARRLLAQRPITAFFNAIGQHSYSLYLVHGPMVRMWCPEGAGTGFINAAVRIAVALVCTIVLAVWMEWIVKRIPAVLSQCRRRWGWMRLATGIIFVIALAAGLLFAADEAVERFDPQEIRGWGELASLESHPDFGWRLKPLTTTHLRWESYDYTVTANSLGFPGPEYPKEKAPGALRIFALGDAFTSAEGVDTNLSWPRLLESRLRVDYASRPVEVMDFAITGYGPEQTVAVAEAFVPQYRPDLIIYGFFVNEYFDVLESNDAFRASIGLTKEPLTGWWLKIHLDQVRRYLAINIGEPLHAVMHGPTESHGYLFGEFAALERGRTEVNVTGKELVRSQLLRLKGIADSVGAKVIVVMVPSSAQVCGPEDLAYYPWRVDLRDTVKYDVDQPQRVTEELAGALGLPVCDLRPTLIAAKDRHPYQRRNMHWTAFGHECVATYLAQRLATDGYLGAR